MAPIEDDGIAVHYTAVQPGTPVISSDGQEVGDRGRVLDNYREHIFDGLVIRRLTARERFVDAPEVVRTAERAVTLNITAAQVAELGPPEEGPRRDRLRQAAVRRASPPLSARRAERAPVAVGELLERALPGAAGRPLRGRPPTSRRRSSGKRAELATAAASASASARRSRRPVRPSSISDSGPPSATATTGSPLACASSTTWPKVSVRLANRKRSALA